MVKSLIFAGLQFRFRRFDQLEKECKSYTVDRLSTSGYCA